MNDRVSARAVFDRMAETIWPGANDDSPLDEGAEKEAERRRRADQRRKAGRKFSPFKRIGPRIPGAGAEIIAGVFTELGHTFNPGAGEGCYEAGCATWGDLIGYTAENSCAAQVGCTGLAPGARVIYPSYGAAHVVWPTFEWAAQWWTRDLSGIGLGIREVHRRSFFMEPGQDVGEITGVIIVPVPAAMPGAMPGVNPMREPAMEPVQDPDEEGYEYPNVRDDAKRFIRVTWGDTDPRNPPQLRRRWNVQPRPKPAPKEVREEKVQFRSMKAYRLFMAALDAYTETGDFVRAIYRGGLPRDWTCGKWLSTPSGRKRYVPPKYRCGKYDMVCQGKAVHDAVSQGKLDVEGALLSLAANQFEDWAIGSASKQHAKIAQGTRSWADYAALKNQQKALRQHSNELAKAMPKECG